MHIHSLNKWQHSHRFNAEDTHVLNNCGHNSHQECSAGVNSKIMKFYHNHNVLDASGKIEPEP